MTLWKCSASFRNFYCRKSHHILGIINCIFVCLNEMRKHTHTHIHIESYVKSLPQMAKLSSAEMPIVGDLHAECQQTFPEMMCVCATKRMNIPRVTCKSEVMVFKVGSGIEPNENEGTGCKTDTPHIHAYTYISN